jgi:hypothetical protein
LRPFETIPGMGIKENGEGINSSMIYLRYFKNVCKCHNVLLPSTTNTNKKSHQNKLFWHLDFQPPEQ